MHVEATARARRLEDIDDCVAMLGLVHTTDGYPSRWPDDPRRWLTPDGFVGARVAADTRGLSGHVLLHRPTGDADASWVSAAAALPPERTALVSRLFVAPRARGAGVGVDLLQTVVKEASTRGLRTALAVAESDHAARALHERCGWQHVDSTPWTWSGGGRTVLHCYLGPATSS